MIGPKGRYKIGASYLDELLAQRPNYMGPLPLPPGMPHTMQSRAKDDECGATVAIASIIAEERADVVRVALDARALANAVMFAYENHCITNQNSDFDHTAMLYMAARRVLGFDDRQQHEVDDE